MRGSGIPQLAFAWESQMDMVAANLGIDPLEFRLINALNPGCSNIIGQVLDEGVAARSVLEALRGPYKDALSRKALKPLPSPWRRGVGLGCVWQTNGGGRGEEAGGGWHGQKLGHARAAVELLEDGRVHVMAGAVEKGQGIKTALAQIACEELRIPMRSLDITLGDTFLAPYPMSTTGQRTTFHAGGALQKVCRRFRKALSEEAARVIEDDPQNIVFDEGHVFSARAPEDRLSLKQLADRLREESLPLKYEDTFVFEKSEKGQGPISSYSAQLSEVDVNVETGQVKVQRVVYVADLDRAINPLSFQGQVEGGVLMGLSFALKEKYIPGETHTLKAYNLPTIRDTPEIVRTLFVEDPVLGGPFGAKGAAEMTVSPGVPSILNAIANATGARIFIFPPLQTRCLRLLARNEGVDASSLGFVNLKVTKAPTQAL